MNKLFVVMALVIGVAFAANADIVYFNPYTSLDNINGRDPLGDPYLSLECDPPILGVVVDVAATGYAVMEDNFAVTVEGGAQDWRNKYLHISLKWEGPEVEGYPWIGMWIRVYDGIWNPELQAYDYAGWSNYFAEVVVNSCFQNFSFDLELPDDSGNYPGARSSVYKYRVDSVLWDEALVPYVYGIDHVLVDQEVPEPTSMALLAIGGLLAIFRRRK